jgi:hypothetical protein
MAKAHDRILEIDVEADETGDTVEVTGVRYYRDRGKLAAGDGFELEHTAGAAGAATELEFGQLSPPPTHIRINSTFV